MAAIVLVYREVRGSTRYLSIVFLTYGVLELAGALAGNYFGGKYLPKALAGVTPSLQTWITNLVDRLLAPTITYCIVLLGAGLVLLIVSFVYPKRNQSVI